LNVNSSKTRIEAFSDGVFAIVITLLVLELKPGEDGASAHDMIVHAVPKILSFALSFVVIGSYWVAHHRMMHFIKTVDRTLLWLNLALLMVVTFVPYPTALVGATHGELDAVRLYGATLMTANLLGTALWLYGTRPEHRADSLVAGQRWRVAAIHAAPIVVYAIAILLAPAAIFFTLACYAAVPLFFIFAGRWVDRLTAGSAAVSSGFQR